MKQIGTLPLKRPERRLLSKVEPRLFVECAYVTQFVFHIPIGAPGMTERDHVADNRWRRNAKSKHIGGGKIIYKHAFGEVDSLHAVFAKGMERNKRHVVRQNRIQPGNTGQFILDRAHEDRVE